MRVIHFTHGATDPLRGFGATGARFLPLADGTGNAHISCLHLETNAKIPSPSLTHAAALLCVHGRIAVTTTAARINIHAGSGCVFEKDESYSLTFEPGAIFSLSNPTTWKPTNARYRHPNALPANNGPATG